MLKKFTVLTRPAPARQDAPFHRQGRSERRPEASLFSPARPKLPGQLVFHVGYVEDLSDARTTLAGFFSILPENYLRVRTDWSAKLTRGLG
jgi:hypothetical protein